MRRVVVTGYGIVSSLGNNAAEVSTSLRDVVRPYGDQGLARIADTPESLVQNQPIIRA